MFGICSMCVKYTCIRGVCWMCVVYVEYALCMLIQYTHYYKLGIRGVCLVYVVYVHHMCCMLMHFLCDDRLSTKIEYRM